MAEQKNLKDNFTFGEISEIPKFEGDTVDQLSEWTRNSLVNVISSGIDVEDRVQGYINGAYKKATEIDENVGTFDNWVNKVLPNEVSKEKELNLFERLDSELTITDGNFVQEFKKNIADPSYDSPELNSAKAKFNNLKRMAIEKPKTFPFASVKDESGKDTVLMQSREDLERDYDSLELAIKDSIDKGALKPRDILKLGGKLKFAEGTQKTYDDLQREFDLTLKVADYGQEIANKAKQKSELTGKPVTLDDFGADGDLLKALNAVELDIRLEHQKLVDTTDTVDPELRYAAEKLPTFALFAGMYNMSKAVGLKALGLSSVPQYPLNSKVPLTDTGEPLSLNTSKLFDKEDLKFINNKKYVADILRNKFEITNLSDDQVLESVKRAMHLQLHQTGGLPYIIDEKNLFLNIKKKENFGITAHPNLFISDDVFDKAIKQHPDLTKEDIQVLNERKDIFWESQSERLLELIGTNEKIENKWRKVSEENNSLDPKKQKPLPELLQSFFNEGENYSYAKDNFRNFLLSTKESIPVLWHGVLGMMGSESATNKGIELQLKKQRRRELSSAFGEGGFFFDLSGVAGDVGVDLGLTALTLSPAAAAARKTALAIGKRKLAAEGYKITKLKGTSNALYNAFFGTDSAAKKELASALLKTGAITPLKTKKFSDDIVKVLSDDLASLSSTKIDKFTQLGATAFGVGAPSGLRSASYAYYSYMESLPDNLSFEEKRSKAVPLALLRGGITAAITVGASYLGKGGVESFAAKKPSKLLQLRGYKPVKNALENLAKMSRATDKAGKSLLVSEVAEISATIARQGLRKSMLFGLGARTIGADLLKVGIDEGIEEGLDEFIGSFVDEYAMGDNSTLESKLGAAAYAGLLGLSMGVGVAGTAKFTGAAAGKLGLGDTTEATETAYKQLVDMVMDQATTLNEAATNARNAQAPLTAEVLEQNRNQLLAGVAKDPVAPATSFRMSLTRDTNISEDRDASEIVTVNADEVVGVAETTNEQGETIYAVEYSPVDASGQVLTAYTKNASVTRLNVRTRDNYKLEQEIIQEIKDEVLIPNDDDQNESLRTAEGVEAATNNFISKHEVALRNNNIKVLIDPTEEQQQGFIDLVEENETYEILQGAESSVQMNSEGEVFIIINTANTSEITNSIPKQRRTTYMQSVFTEALASSFELVSTRDKYFNLDPEVRGDLSLEEFIDAERLLMYSEMSQYERDWAASLILGEDVEEGLSEKVSDKSLIASTHINSLLQLDMSGQVKGVQKTAWSGKSRGGALSKNVKQKLYDILSYLRAAVRTATTTASRDFLRRHINYISDNLTKPFFDAVANLSDADQARVIDEVKESEVAPSNQKVNPIEDSPLVGSLPQSSLETVPKEIKRSTFLFSDLVLSELNFEGVEQYPSSDTLIGRNEDGDLVVLQSMTLAEAEIHLSNLEKLKGQFIDPSTPVKIFISPNSTPNTDANTQVILQTEVKSSSFSLNSVQGSPDSPSLRQAILENPLFSRNMVESDLDGDNILYKMEEDPDRPSSINLYAVPKVLRFTRELTQEDINALNEEANGVNAKNFSEETTLEILKNVIGNPIEFAPSLSQEAKDEIDVNTERSSETASEDYIEPVQQTSVEGTGTDTEDPPKANNKQKENDLKVAKKIYSSLQRRLLREGTRYYEGVREGNAVAWYSKAKRMIGINPSLIPSLLRDNNRLAAKAIMNLAVDEELIHQISWETLTYNERKRAIQELLNADRRGANALIMMVQEYNTKIRGYSPDEAIQILRLGLPESDSLPEGIEDTPANRVTRDEVAEYIFEELIRKHVSLVNGRGATETDYDFLKQKENQGVLNVYRKYIENFFVGRLKAKKALRKDSKLGPYYATAVAKVAQEFKAAKEGFRRRPDYDKLDLDIDLGVYSKQSTLIGTEISTVAPEDEQREEWLSEIDPQEVKKSVVKGRTVGTRSPSAKGKAGEGVDPNKVVTLKDLRENPEAYKKNALILLNYPIVAREFKGNSLLEKVRKAKAPVNKAELKKQQLRQDLKSAKTTLKNDLITYKVNERSDELKPQRKQEADDLKKQYADSEAAVKQIEKEVTKLNNSLKRAKKRLRETISKENKKVNALIKKAQARGNQADLEVLQQRKADIKNILSNDSETAELIEGINNNIADAKQRLATIKKLSNANKRSFEKALKEFSKPTVKRTSIKVSASQVVDTIEQFESDIAEGLPVRVGAKSLVAKLNAIKKKEKELESAVKDATNKTSKFGDSLKKLSQSERAFPIETADEIFASLNDVAQKNLSLLIKLFPQDLRVYASLWYDGANIIANKFAKTFDISVEQAAAVLAVFSPQKDWYMNVALAERTMHIFKARQSALFDASMSSNFLRRGGEPELKYDKNGNPFYEGNALPVYDEDGNHITDENGVLQFDNWNNEKAKDKFELTKKILSLGLAGKRFNEIEAISFTHKGKQKNFSKEALQARFIRMFSEAAENEALRDPKTFNVIRPDGAILERPSMSEKGAPRSIAWGSYVTIEKAIRVLNEDQENPMDAISNELGLMHKVRSFYNNIVDPSSRAGHVTMDTHAIAALLLKPVSGNSIEVTQNFGGQGTASDSNLGISGLYPAFAEAYRSVSFTNDTTDSEYLVREIQSITWEAVRMLFPSKWKANKNHVRAIEELHAKYEEGIISLEQLQEQIYSFVQTSQAKGMPADEALSISEGIQSANTVRGLGVGRPDWGQATSVRVDAPPSEQEEFNTISWRNLEARHAELAGMDVSEKNVRREEIEDLFKKASRKAEEKIPDYFEFVSPLSLTGEQSYIYKNPKGVYLKRDANKKDYNQFILTPANKYMFSPDITAREAAIALGLNEYVIVTEATSSLEPDKVIIHVNDGTTEPYYRTGAGVEIVKSFYGDEAKVLFDIEKKMGVPLKAGESMSTSRQGDLTQLNRFLYDSKGRLIPLSVRFAPYSEVSYQPQDVRDPIEQFGETERILRNPYDDSARRAEYSLDFIVPIDKKLDTNIESILNTVIDYRNASDEESAMVPIAKFLLETLSDEMLRWRVHHDPKDKEGRSYSSPDPDIGIMLARSLEMNVPEDFPQAEKTTSYTNYLSDKQWILKKFKTPLDAITKWKGIRDALDPYNVEPEDSYEYLPDVEDFGNFNDLPPEDKEILNEFIKYNVHNYEVGVTIFDSNGDADLYEIGRSIKLNLKDNPDLEKYIDWTHVFNFFNRNPYYDNEGRKYRRSRRPDTTSKKVSYKVNGVAPSTIIHEVFHALTQRQIDKHVISKRAKGLRLYSIYQNKSLDSSVPEPLRELLRVYLKAVDYGDQYLQLRQGIKPTKRSRHVSKMMGTGFKNAADKAAEKQFYGLGNVDEFVTMSMMSPEFQTWLMAIPDIEAAQNGETKSLWDRFTEIITNILNTLRKDPDFVRDRGVEGGANLLNSAIKSVMEVAAFNGNINRNLASMGYESVSEWQTIKGANAAKAEAETLRKGKTEEFIEKNGLNLPPINREILSGVYNYEPEEASGTTSPATVATYENLYAFIENKAYGKSLQEFMADYNVLDWGSGMGRGSEKLKQMIAEGGRYGDWRAKQRIKLESYEPFFVEGKGRTAPSLKRKPRKETQDLIINSQVVNVIPADERAQLLQDIYASLKEEGQAIITTRTPSDIVKQLSEKTMKVVGPAEYISYVDGKATTYQKGFSAKSLKKFIEEVLPEADVVTTGVDISPTYAVITKPKSAGIELDSDPEESVVNIQKSASEDFKKELDQFSKIKGEPKVSGAFFDDMYKSMPRGALSSLIRSGKISSPYLNSPSNVAVTDLDRSFHFTKKYAHLFSELLINFDPTYDEKNKDTFFKPTVKPVAHFVLQQLADLAVSLPAVQGFDGVSRRMVDPFSIIKRHFKGGEKQPVEKVIRNLFNAVNSIDDIWTRTAANRDIVNLAELAEAVGSFNKDLPFKQGQSPFVREMQAAADAVRKERDDSLEQFTKIRGEESFPEMFSEKKKAEENVTEELSATFDVDVERIFALLGPKMYDSKLKDIVYKESLQNSYDAIKDLENRNPQIWRETKSQPQIEYGVWDQGNTIRYPSLERKPWKWGERILPASYAEELSPPPELLETIVNDLEKEKDIDDKQWVYIRDNGIGMSPEIIKSAYFTLGGSYKESDNPSGGFGLAKISMLRAAQEIFVKTVRDGVESTVRVDNKTLISKKPFQISSREVDAPSGTQVWMKFPKEVDGESVYLGTPSFNKKILDEKRQLLIIKEHSVSNTLSLKSLENYGYEKTSVRTLQADIDIFAYEIGDLDKDGKDISHLPDDQSPTGQSISNRTIEYYSNGLFQFSKSTPAVQNERVPYNIKVNIKPRVPADSMDYPFANTREKFSPQWSGKKSPDDDHPVEEEVNKVVRKYGREYFRQKFEEEFSIISGIDGNQPRPSVPIVYNNLDFDLDPSETELMNEFASIVNNIADQFLGVYKHDFYENDNSLGSNDDVGEALRNYEKTDAENDPNFKGVSYHYGSALSKNWGGVNTGINPRVILVNPVYGSLNFTEDGELNKDVGVEGLAAFLTDIILHEVNHIGQRNEGAGFTYPFSAVRAYHSQMNPIFEESNRLIQDLIINKYESIKTLRKKFVKGSTKFLNAELQANKFVNTFAEPDNVRGREVRSRGEIVEQNFGKGVSPDEVQETNRGITVLEAIVGRTFRANQVKDDPPVQDTKISVKVREQDNKYLSLAKDIKTNGDKLWGLVKEASKLGESSIPRVSFLGEKDEAVEVIKNPTNKEKNKIKETVRGEDNDSIIYRSYILTPANAYIFDPRNGTHSQVVKELGIRDGIGVTISTHSTTGREEITPSLFEQYENIGSLYYDHYKAGGNITKAGLQLIHEHFPHFKKSPKSIKIGSPYPKSVFNPVLTIPKYDFAGEGKPLVESEEVVLLSQRFNLPSDDIQYTQIRVQPTEDWTLYAGKQVGGLYISSDAIENGYSVLEKPANQEKKRKFEEAKARLATYLEEERTQAELDGQVYVPFSYDVVSIEKDQVRFVLMSDLTEAHPHVVESLRVPNDPEKPVQEGRTGNAIYHRMEQILGFKHPLYQYHKTITDLEEGLGLLNLKDDNGKKVFPSGSERVWKQQVESTGYRYDSLKEEHRKIKQKFFGDPQDTIIGMEDITQTPEYIESSEAWDTLIDILRADIKVIEEDPDDVAGPIPNPVKFLQRKIYGKDAEMNWRKGGAFWSLFYGPYERTLRKYKNKSSFFKKAIQDVVLSYKSTTDRLLKETYTDNGLDIPSRTIFEATGTTQFAPSEEVAQAIQDRYLDKVDEINKDSSLEGDAKKEALLEAYNEREAEKQLAARDVLVAARKRKSEALEKLRQDSPELAKHIISLRKLAGSISSEIGNMVSLASPELQLKIDERQDIYLTTQYRMFTRPNWTEEFLELDIHRDARDLALDYFAGEYVRTQTEHLVREGGLDKETAEAQALDNLENKPELTMMALENFLRSYDKDFGVDSLKRKANLPAALRGALGEFSEETNMDVLYRTLLNLGTLISKMSLKDKLVSQGIKSGWLVTQEKAALERKRAEDAGRPDPYEDYVEVVKSKDSTISEELAGSLDDTGVQVKGEGFEVKLNPDGTVKETPRSKPPTSDPLIDYRVRTEDGSVERKGNLLARPDVKQAIIQVLNPKQGMSTPDNEYVQIALKLFGGIEKGLAGLTGLGMLSKTLGSIPFYERQVLGSFLFLSQNGIPISGYIPALFGKDGEIGRSVLPSGVFKKRSYLEGRSADRGDMAYYASLKSMGVLDEGIVYSILKDLLSGNISKEDVELEIDHLKHPTKSILKKSKLFAEGTASEKALRKAAEIMKAAGKVKDIPVGKAQALALALDNAIKVQAYEYERSWLLDAREDSQTADRADEYRDLSNAELDEMAAQIVLRTQQSRSQSAPIVEFFNLPVVRIGTAPFARFLAENPRLLVNIMRQSSAEMNSSNPVIKERGSQRNRGFLFTNFVLYMALPMFLQRFVAGLGDDEERVLRKSSPEFSRFQNLFYFKNEEGNIGTMSLSYVHPMSPILDFAMRGFEHTMRGDIKEAIQTVTIGYLTDTFLNDQIFWSAVMDVKNNEHRDTGQPITGEYTPDSLKVKLAYIFDKGLAPPTLQALSKSTQAIGADYPKDKDARTFAGYPIYSPKGQFFRHLTPVKFYPLQLESMARRRFREIYDNMYIDSKVKNKLRKTEQGYRSDQIDEIVRNENESLTAALKDARLAYNVYTDLLGSEGLVQEIMKGSRMKSSLIDVISSGYYRPEDLMLEGESLMDSLREQGLDARSYQLYQSYMKLIDEQPMIPLD